MDEIRDSLLRMYRSAKDLKKMYETFKAAGISADSLFDTYGNVADAIFYLIGEKTENFNDSVTALVLGTVSLSEDRAVEILMREYERNILGCKFNFMNKEQLDELYRKNGGYKAPETPEGEWK